MSQHNIEDESELEYVPLQEDGYLSLTDLSCAAALIVSGFELSSLDKSEPRKVKFILKGRDGIAEVMKKFWDCDLQVDALTYFNVIRRLKNQIYSNY